MTTTAEQTAVYAQEIMRLQRDVIRQRITNDQLVIERDILTRQCDDLVATMRHIDGIAAFKAATGRDTEAWQSVLAFTRAALAKVQP